MSDWRRIRIWVIVGAAVIFSVGACASTGPEIIKLAGGSSMAGEVAFNHGKHAGDMEDGGYHISCDRCHHDIWQERGKPSRSCRKCHRKESVQPASFEEIAHKQCIECHDELRVKDPKRRLPASCPDCHVFKEPKKK